MSISHWQDLSYEIIDAHHHLWDLEAVHYPWLMAKGVKRFFGDPAPIQNNYLVSDFVNDFGDVPISRSVHIQVGAADDQHLDEARWLQQQHQRTNFPSAFVAFCHVERSSLDQDLKQLLQLNAFRGVRQIVGRHPDEDKITRTDSLLGQPKWSDGLRLLAQHELSFDLQLIPEQMQAAYEVLCLIPDLRVALCHCGSPWYRDQQGWELWHHGLKQLASLPNVYCKISGLSMFDNCWSVETLQPIFDAVLDAFGANRCMFGSNFPVDKLYTDYQYLWHSYWQLSNDLSDTEKRLLFGATCQDFYRL